MSNVDGHICCSVFDISSPFDPVDSRISVSITHVGKQFLSCHKGNMLEYTVHFITDRLGSVHISGTDAL